MKAYEIQAFGFENVKLVDREDPRPGPGQVLLEMTAWSLNFRDLMIAKGQYNPKLRMPAVPLSDGVGRVVEVGPGVSRAKVGDRVAGAFMTKWICGEVTEDKARSALGGGGPDGMLAQRVVLDEGGVVHLPQHLSDEEAATLPCAAVTAWHALIGEGRLAAGDIVLVQGTGGVSIFALQFARLHGARVIVTSSRDDKLARALELGGNDG
ncbi:MAG TPA: NAD(P)-dependent alcohol dehydrogenase, partial [Pirellulales bacterium]